ncbi:GntR family transcriptional regulator [Phytohabitans sp. ZYX-F-186]|uniref:GntR family transcriptional regulator n=1 Tax=Phytohabitans maris TaxID=3071409 RepID=A0ABU0ZJM5_9ACTN|nr:FCD domain-containing protein [Phytohabitans sp. ZYX-F-186]MDQ7907248.1 GntR family transcriptional regulator [Phytohabitans sp. ZYX-F-186]
MGVEGAVRPPAYQTLAEDLRAEITSGRLQPGERLPTEPQLCARSGVSRSTVREALRLLASQHLIVTTRGVTGGSFVAHPSPENLSDTLSTGLNLLINASTASLCDLLEVRESLEVPAAGQAARRRSEEHLAAMELALFDPRTADVPAMLVAHRLFHAALGAATGNPLYELLSRPLYQVANEREVAATAPPGFWLQIDADHRELLRCVRAQDAEGATKVACDHITFIRTALAPRV